MRNIVKAVKGILIGSTVTALAVVAPQAMATGQYDSITAAVSYTDAAAAIIAVFALVAVLYLAWKGGKMVLNAIKG